MAAPTDRRPHANPSVGATPFGFSFDEDAHLVATNAAGGAPGAGTVSSYAVRRDGSLETLAGAVPTAQSAVCWVAIAGPYAYAANTGPER